MTKGHNQDKHKQSNPKAEQHKHVPHQDEHLKNNDSSKNKSPHQGRSSGEDPSGGTKGQNSI